MVGLDYIVRVSGPDIPGFERRYNYIYPLLTPMIKAIWHDARYVVVKCQEELDLMYATDQSIRYKIIPNGVDSENVSTKWETLKNWSFEIVVRWQVD